MLWGLTRSLPLTTTTVFRKWLPTLLHLITSLYPQTYFLSSFLSSQFLKGINESCLLILQSMSFAWSPTESLGEQQKWGLESANSLFRSPEKHKWNKQLSPPQMFSLTHEHTHGEILACALFPFLVGDKEGSPLGLAAGPTLGVIMG